MKRFKLKLVSGLFVALVLLIMGVVRWPQLRRQLDSWRLLPRPETYTELYFEPQHKLAYAYNPGQDLQVSFVVSNHESQTVTYHYKIVAKADQSEQVLSTGQTVMAVNQQRNLAPQLHLPDTDQALSLVVELTYYAPLPNRDQPVKQQQHISHLFQSARPS